MNRTVHEFNHTSTPVDFCLWSHLHLGCFGQYMYWQESLHLMLGLYCNLLSMMKTFIVLIKLTIDFLLFLSFSGFFFNI